MFRKKVEYNVRIEVCGKCHEHVDLLSKRKKFQFKNQSNGKQQKQLKITNQFTKYVKQEEQYQTYFQNLVKLIHQLQNQYNSTQINGNKNIDDTLKNRSINQSQLQKGHNFSITKIPSFSISKNKPYQYLTKLPDSKTSTKRYLNNTNNKIVQFPKKDSFEIYFQNLFLFSKISFQKWPHLKLIISIIKILVQYCQNQGPLMNHLSNFINQYLDIKSFNPSEDHTTISLYQFLIISSTLSETSQIQKLQQQILYILQNIVNGNINLPSNINLYTNQLFHNINILPYSLLNQKVKKKKLQNIYLSQSSKILKNKNKIEQSKIKNKMQLYEKRDKHFKGDNFKRKNLLQSNLKCIKKSKSLQLRKKNQVFLMIKMGDYQKYLSQLPNFNKTKYDKKLQQQISNFCQLNATNNTQRCSKVIKKPTFFLSNKLSLHQNKIEKQNKLQEKFNSNNRSKLNQKVSQLRNKNKANKLKTHQSYSIKQFNQNQNITANNKEKTNQQKRFLIASPSNMTKRSSFFLNQKQQNMFSSEVKNLAAGHLNYKHRISQNINSVEFFKNKNKINRKQSTQSKKSIAKQLEEMLSSSSSSYSEQNNDSFQDFQGKQMKQSYKLKVLKNNLEKKRSRQSIKSGQSSVSSARNSNLIQNQAPQIENNSILLKTPGKLSVRSRRKSSFYYSNVKNNSLLQLISQANNNVEKQQKEKKKLKRKASRLQNKTIIKVSMIQEGIQVDLQKQNQNQSNKFQQFDINSKSQNKSIDQKNRILIQKQNIQEEQINKNIRVLSSNHELIPSFQSKQKIEFIGSQERKKNQNSEYKENLFYVNKNLRESSRVSNLSRISKFSFQNNLNNKDLLNLSKEKDINDQMVSVFPQNKFSHAFIVNKFSQKENYELQIKKIFTTNLTDKYQNFDFQIKCQEQCRPIQIISLNKFNDAFSFKKITLFPKIVQQIQTYSSPLTEVVNRLLKFHPITITRLFTNAHGISPLGQYCVWVFHKQINQFKPVFINDSIAFFECQDKKNQLFQFDKRVTVYGPVTNENSIWFLLLEKAMAKVLGSYYKLNETSIGQLFSMLTGCPVINIKSFTVTKLRKIFNQKIFLNKKAYIYTLRKQNEWNMKIERVTGMFFNEDDPSQTKVKIQQNQDQQVNLSLDSLVKNYSEISLIFFNLNYYYNQIKLPLLKKQDKKCSNLISFYLFNEQNEQKNDLYLYLGGFGRKNLYSKIIIYQQMQEKEDNELKQLQVTDPLKYYESKYIYQGQIKKKGNYFFQTQITYGKFLCLIQAEFQVLQQYYLSVYSFKPIMVNDVKHNYQEEQKKVLDPLEKAILNNKLRRKLKKEKLESIQEDEFSHKRAQSTLGQRRDKYDSVIPYNFSNYKQGKKKFKSCFSLHQDSNMNSKWVIQRQFVEDQQFLEQQKQKQICRIINKIEKIQKVEEHNKIRKVLRSEQKDAIVKMMRRMQQNGRRLAKNTYLQVYNKGLRQERRKKEVQGQDKKRADIVEIYRNSSRSNNSSEN